MSVCNVSAVYRAQFSALTAQEIQTAFSQLTSPDKLLAMAVDARQELDLKIGVAFTRLMTRAFLNHAKTKFRLQDQKVLSYGPCQTPTLWFVAERHREIQSFKREETYLPKARVWPQNREVSPISVRSRNSFCRSALHRDSLVNWLNLNKQ